MKIVLVSTFFPSHREGRDIVAGRLATELAHLGMAITWFASSATPAPETLAGLTVHPMRCGNWSERKLGMSWPVWSPMALVPLWRAVKAADAVHIHDCLYMGSMMAFVVAKLCRKPVVFTQHSEMLTCRSKLLSRVMRMMTTAARAMLVGAERAVFSASRTRDYFRTRITFRRPPLLIPHGVDSQKFHPVSRAERMAIRRRLGIAEDAIVNLFVGRFVEKKGLNLLRELVHANPDMTWCFLGCGPLDPRLWGEKNVLCPGVLPQDAMADYYRAADLFVLPSFGDGFPLAVQEAMFCGTPSLVTNDTAAGLEQPPACLLTASLTALAFGGAIRGFHRSKQSQDAYRSIVAGTAASLWGWEQIGSAYYHLFAMLTGNPESQHRTKEAVTEPLARAS